MTADIINIEAARRDWRDAAYSDSVQERRLHALIEVAKHGDAVQSVDMLANVLCAARPGDRLVEGLVAEIRLTATVYGMAAAILAECGAAITLRRAKSVVRTALSEHPACHHEVAASIEEHLEHRCADDIDDVRGCALAAADIWESMQ